MEGKKKKQRIAYIALAVLAVFTVAFVWLGASGTLTNWRAQYIAEKEYEELLASASDVTDEMTLRALLLLEEELEITVSEDIQIKTAFLVNGTKTLRGEAVLSSNLGILNPISILNVTTDAKLTIDGLTLDCNANAVGVKVENGGELTYLSGDIKFAGTYGIVTNGLVTIEDIKITESTTGALNVGYDGKAYFKGGQIVDNRHIGIYVEAQGYLEISGDATLEGTSGQGIRNRGELVVNGGIFKDIGRFVISNHNKLLIESKDNNRITMTDIGQGIVYNQDKGEAIIKDVHGIELGQDAFKSVGGTMTVENCIVDTVKTHGFYVSYSELTIKDTIINKPGSCGVYAITPAVVTLENVEFNDTGSRGIMAKGATITGTDVTINNPKNYGVSSQTDSNNVYGLNEYTNLTITGAQNNGVYLGGGAEMVINDSTLGEAARTNVYVNNGELTLNNVEILGSTADNCAAISINKWGICNLVGNSKIHGNGIRGVNISGVFNMKGGEIYGYDVKKFSGGAVRLYKGGTFNMSGGKIYNNKTELAGGAVYMASNTTFNMTGGTITNNTATTTGGAVHMATATKFNMKGGTISNNKTLKASGGAVYTYSKMTMSGGTIANNQSNTVGGAINLNSGTNSDTKQKEYGSFTMTGGTIQKNHSNGNGGGLHISGGTTVVMSGGRIVDNTSEKQGSGINHNGNFTMSGSAYVGGNVVTLGGTSKTVTILGESLSAHSAVNPLLIEPAYATEKGTAVAVCESDAFSGNIIKMVAPGNKAYASFAKQNEKIVIGSYNEKVDMDMTGAETVYVSDFQKLKDEVESTKTKKNVVICADIKMEGVITIPTSTTVAIRDDGVKRTLTRDDGNTTSFFRTSFGTGLYLTGTKDGNLVLNGKTTGEVDQAKVQQLVVVRGATEIENVTFKDNETTKLMGAFVRHLYGSLNVENSTFSGALATAGGAISAANGTETITNCTFIDNETTGGGAAIRVDKNATVTVVDSEFKSNNAGSVGGAINNDGGVLVVKTSAFAANTSKGTSGAINLTNKATAEIKASTFDGNKSTEDDAGAIKVNKSTLALEGTTFRNNTTTNDGGAIFVAGKIDDTTYANVTATDCTFESNRADDTGGAIKGETGVVITLTDSAFNKNAATGSTGGAIDLYRSTVNATGCTFTENTAKVSGGAIYLNKEGVANVKTSTFTSNTSATAGGAIYVLETAAANVEGSAFNANSTGNNGGAMFVNYGAVADVKDSSFTGNFTTKWQGGAIANQNGQLTVAGTTFEGNYSEVSNGGAIYINENKDYTYESVTTLEAGNTFTGNYTKAADKDGGAIYIAGTSELEVKAGNTFQENTATGDGGAIYISAGEVKVAGKFLENEAKSEGGAIYTIGTLNCIESTVFKENTSSGSGGAVYVKKGGNAEFTKVTFEKNQVTAESGGAVYAQGTVTAATCTFDSNETSKLGGAIYIPAGGKATVKENSAFTSNLTKKYEGGAIANKGSLEINDSTFTSNTAKTYGGAVYAAAESTLNSVNNCTFYGNTGTSGGAIYVENKIDEDTKVETTATVTVIGGLFEGNTITATNGSAPIRCGGAIANLGVLQVENVTFKANTATYRGGAIWSEEQLAVNGCTFDSNVTTNDGGAVYVATNSKKTNISGTKFTKNETTANNSRGAAIYVQGTNTDWTTVELTGCNIYENELKASSASDPGCDVLVADRTILNLNNNTCVGVIQQKWGSGNNTYAIINVQEEYTGTDNMVIIPVGYTELFADKPLVHFDNMSDDAIANTAGKIEIRKYSDKETYTTEYYVLSDGTITSHVAMIGDVYYKSLKEAVAAAKTGETINVIANETISEAITVDGNKAITIKNMEGKDTTISRGSELNAAPLFTVNSGSTLTLGGSDETNNFTVDGKEVSSTSTLILVNSGATLNLAENATIQNAYAKTTTVEGNKTSKNCGGALYNNGGTVNLAGNFTGNKAYNGGAVYNFKGTLNITDGNYTSNVAAGQGGAVYVGNQTTTTTTSASIKNAVITSNEVTNSTKRGGAIYIQGNATTKTTLSLIGCEIYDNVPKEVSSATDPACDILPANNSILNVYDNDNLGIIKKKWGTNTATSAVINIMADYNGSMIIIPDEGNFTVNETQLVNFGDEVSDKATSASKITVRCLTKTNSGVDVKDDVYYVDTDGILQAKKVARISESFYSTLDEAIKAANDGDVVEIIQDTTVSASSTVTGSKKITIKNQLNQTNTLSRATTLTGAMFVVESGSNLTLGNVTASDEKNKDEGKLIIDGKSLASTSSLITNAGTFTLAENATIQNANRKTGSNDTYASADKGGALYNDGTVIINGSLKGNKAYNGGAVFMNKGSLTVAGGTISNNIASNNGGAVKTEKNTTITFKENSVFSNNSAGNGGGVISLYLSDITAQDCKFTSNSATGGNGCGAIRLESGSATNGGCTATISGCEFTSNSATSTTAGAIQLNTYATATISGCEFTSNSASTYGGAIYSNSSTKDATTSATLVIQNSIFDANMASQGGAVYSNAAGTIKMSGGTYRNQVTTGQSGVILIKSNTILTMEGGIYTDNTSGGFGGVLHTEGASSQATITGGTFQGNKAKNGGGVVDIYQGKVTIEGATMTGNQLTFSDDGKGVGGGAICIRNGGSNPKLTLKNDNNITNNSSDWYSPSLPGSDISIQGKSDSIATLDIEGVGENANKIGVLYFKASSATCNTVNVKGSIVDKIVLIPNVDDYVDGKQLVNFASGFSSEATKITVRKYGTAKDDFSDDTYGVDTDGKLYLKNN